MGSALKVLDGPGFDEIVKAAQAGESAALKQLVLATQTRLFKFCLALTHNPEQAQDVMQDVYIKVFAAIKNLSDPNAYWPWLFRIAKNSFLDSKRNAAEESSNTDDTFLNQLMDPLSATEREDLLAVQQTLSHFKTEDRLLILLVDLEEYAYHEAAEILGISENAVRSRLHRLRARFLEIFKARETK